MAKNKSTIERKIDAFSRAAFLDKDGKPKSAVWLYAFMLAVLFAVFYVAVHLGAGLLFGRILPEESFWTVLLHYLTTAIVGSALCLLFCLFLKGPRRCFVFYAYIWLAIITALMFLTTLVMCDWTGGNGWLDLWQFCFLLYIPAVLSILAGGIPARILWHRELQKQYETEQQSKSRPSYYNS